MSDLSNSFYDQISRRNQGRLKIYIGMIAGVGKSYRMLQEAHDLLKKGVDIRIGEIVTHGRKETEALVDGIPIIPKKEIFYKSKKLTELNLEDILDIKPSVVIVDELAHSNIPGSQHEKRWQDVLKIIEAGINVITAFNVQHLESLHDQVHNVTGIEVHETIPDHFLEYADEVVNIDLPSQDLIQRLKDGKIYSPERAEYALEHFFQPEKILHLRDLALRKVAEKVEHKISNTNPNTPFEKFLACISTNHKGAKKILRKVSRMSAHYQAKWVVLYVQTSKESTHKVNLASQRKLLLNLKWAAEQGAKTMKKESDDVAEAIYEAIKEEKITTVIIGKPQSTILDNLLGKNYFKNLLNKLEDQEIDIVIVA
ncbi:sensor protein KdpD [Psychroflexus planctonicus]|nr:sensor protein KdpD [Psychroflexus planctonicus]